MHFFRTFLPKYFAVIEKSYNFALAFQGQHSVTGSEIIEMLQFFDK